LVETASPNVSRIKSLIKPPPPRTSWELLLDDYLKDPNFKTNLSPNISPSNEQPNIPLSQPISPNLFQQTFIPSPYYQYPSYSSCVSCQTKPSLPPRRYQMTLDELVYLISQVGRSDLYREMIQYIKTQQLPPTANVSSPHPPNKSFNINACSTIRSADQKKKKDLFSSEVQDRLIRKLNRLKLDRRN
jgi:hypothetical protein